MLRLPRIQVSLAAYATSFLFVWVFYAIDMLCPAGRTLIDGIAAGGSVAVYFLPFSDFLFSENMHIITPFNMCQMLRNINAIPTNTAVPSKLIGISSHSKQIRCLISPIEKVRVNAAYITINEMASIVIPIMFLQCRICIHCSALYGCFIHSSQSSSSAASPRDSLANILAIFSSDRVLIKS